MKKIIGIFLLSVLMLSGCSSKDETKTVTCELNENNMSIEYVLGYDDNKILKTFEGKEVVNAGEEISDDRKSAIEELFKSTYAEIDGAEYELIFNEDKKEEVEIRTTINLSEYDFENDVLGILSYSESEDTKDLKVEDMVKGFEANGIECGEVK